MILQMLVGCKNSDYLLQAAYNPSRISHYNINLHPVFAAYLDKRLLLGSPSSPDGHGNDAHSWRLITHTNKSPHISNYCIGYVRTNKDGSRIKELFQCLPKRYPLFLLGFMHKIILRFLLRELLQQVLKQQLLQRALQQQRQPIRLSS